MIAKGSRTVLRGEGGSNAFNLPDIRYLKKIPFDLAIFDEAHNAANLMSNQGTAFIRLAASAKRVLCLTATVTNGMAKSLYNLLWGINPVQMREAGWDMKSATDFQARFGAYKEVRKTDERNRHRESEKVHTYDTAGISPAALVYTLPNFVNVNSEDFDDLPPVEREVIKCRPHAEVEECMRTIDKIIENAELPIEDKMPAASVRTAAFLGCPTPSGTPTTRSACAAISSGPSGNGLLMNCSKRKSSWSTSSVRSTYGENVSWSIPGIPRKST